MLNDFNIYLKELNKYTNYGDENHYQKFCDTNRYDVWVINIDDCPEGYPYTIDNSLLYTKSAKCFLIFDWTSEMYSLRYE